MKKRQEIGRGLRLCVNKEGDRVFDSKINVLTVIPNESYRDFAAALQTEYDEADYKQSPQITDKRGRIKIKFRKNLPTQSEDFKKLWEKINKKTAYNIELQTKELIDNAIEKIDEKLDSKSLVIRVEKVKVDFEESGKILTVYEGESVGEEMKGERQVPNVVDRIVKETGITRKTAYEIMSQVSNLEFIFKNPEEYLRSVVVIIKNCLNELLINDGLKYTPIKDVWELSLFEDFESYESKAIKTVKSFYDHVVFDSEGERKFAQALEASSRVKLFSKLPASFVIDTPLGTYNPDWAIVMTKNGKEKLYLVRETKFDIDLEELRLSERQKILCGQKHFDAIGVDFKVAQEKDLSGLI
jgi:type III restriction enzyme